MKINDKIYMDYQATTPVDARVVAEMVQHFGGAPGNPHSVDHFFGWQAARAVEQAADRVARLIGADPDEIVFTSGATEANNLALLGLGRGASGGNRRRILVSAIEHKCVLAACRALHQQLGYVIDTVPVDAAGRVDISALEHALSDDVLVVSIMAVNNEIGTIQDVGHISKIINDNGALFHCDAAQAPCAIDLHKYSSFVDLLSLSSHKMYGPQGVGALYIRREIQGHIEPLVYGGGQQRGLRSGTVPVALCVGLGVAADILADADGAEAERAAMRNQRDTFIRKLTELSWPVSLNGADGALRHPGNANMRFDGFDAHDILSTLQPRLAASTGAACVSGMPEPSHVLRAIGLSKAEAESSIRFSIGRSTSNADLDEAVGLLDEALTKISQT